MPDPVQKVTSQSLHPELHLYGCFFERHFVSGAIESATGMIQARNIEEAFEQAPRKFGLTKLEVETLIVLG